MKPEPGEVSLENLRAHVDRLALLADDRSFVRNLQEAGRPRALTLPLETCVAPAIGWRFVSPRRDAGLPSRLGASASRGDPAWMEHT
jgi:hypothetical protein